MDDHASSALAFIIVYQSLIELRTTRFYLKLILNVISAGTIHLERPILIHSHFGHVKVWELAEN